ncbi:hypothetical protein DdX_12892 [Ditylenchus destructor]|uniref:Uncharacterized protein n=1 Tax=Ditylenchus destructor TaxID=166010 RepID=A0AAD4MXV8_9BILA|nr:hypothetical protein DdX_12892 [Ditylenchus destructor]
MLQFLKAPQLLQRQQLLQLVVHNGAVGLSVVSARIPAELAVDRTVNNSTSTIICNIIPCRYPRLSCCPPYRAMGSNGSIICGPQPLQPTEAPSNCSST